MTNLPQKEINPEFDDSIFGPKAIISHAQQFLKVEQKSPNEIISDLLSQVHEINFEELAGVGDETKLTNAHYRILAVRHILLIAHQNNWGLCRNQAFVYLFNGFYWTPVDQDELKSFLGKAAEKMGVPWVKSGDFVFRNALFDQFFQEAHFAPQIKKDRVLIPLLNGTFEISNGGRILREFNKNDFLTYQLPFKYDSEATSPLFDSFLNRVLPDLSSQAVLAEFIGYLFTTGVKLEKALILFGTGANGKSVVFEVVSSLLGVNNVSNYSLSRLTDSTGYYRAMIANKLVNYASEINGTLETSLFKQLVSGEPIDARLPYGNPMIISHYAKLIFNANSLPHDVEHTNAFFRRFLVIPFDVTIKPEEQDIELSKKIIQSELPGVFNRVLSGLERILQNKAFTPSDAIKNQVEIYRKQSDTVAMFLEDEEYSPSITDSIPLKELYPKYKCYAFDGSYRPVSSKTFGDRLRNLGYQLERKRGGFIVHAQRL